jgi:ParB family chromosome partitioning protein
MSNEPSDPARAQAIPIDAITIDGGRIREDMGDIDDLAESMRQFGMLQPVGISPDRRLSYGERRLLAAQRAGLTHVPVIIKACTEAERVLFEIEENRARKPFTPSEAVRAKRK